MATGEVVELKGSGRLKLQGALEELVQQSKDAEEKEVMDVVQDPAVEEAAKSLVELPNSIKLDDMTGAKRKGFVSPKKRRRRRKKEHMSTSDVDSDGDTAGTGRHIPHVMTLFDRRVDLARFSEATPLYVMCREWMRNNPHRRQSQSYPGDGEITTDGPKDQDLLCFPTPQPASRGQSPNIPVALPPHDTAQSLDQELAKQSAGYNGEKVECLRDQHVQRWKTIKSRWVTTSHAEQDRYKDSLKILHQMFQK